MLDQQFSEFCLQLVTTSQQLFIIFLKCNYRFFSLFMLGCLLSQSRKKKLIAMIAPHIQSLSLIIWNPPEIIK